MSLINEIQYLADEQIDSLMDEKLRALLTRCFGEVFKDKRYYAEMPAHRWLIDKGDHLAAHLAIHEKLFYVGSQEHPFLGIAEVCVAPEYRKQGLVKALLHEAERKFPNYAYAILLGDKNVYSSSGYVQVDNVYFPDKEEGHNEDAMIKCLKDTVWFEGKVTIPGASF